MLLFDYFSVHLAGLETWATALGRISAVAAALGAFSTRQSPLSAGPKIKAEFPVQIMWRNATPWRGGSALCRTIAATKKVTGSNKASLLSLFFGSKSRV